MPRKKINLTPNEEVPRVLQWAGRQGFADVPEIVALHDSPSDHAIQCAITWAEGRVTIGSVTTLSVWLWVAYRARGNT
jgi:hypothetical protein